MDALSLSDGTIDGAAALLAERLPRLPERHVPAWVKALPREQLQERLAEVIAHAFEATSTAQDVIEQETAKGRALMEVYEEVFPILEAVSRGEKGHPDSSCRVRDPLEPEQLSKEALGPVREAALPKAPRCCLGDPVADTRHGRPPSGRMRFKDFRGPALVGGASMPAPAHGVVTDAREPLLLLGSFNNWDANVARRLHSLRPIGKGRLTWQESILEVEVSEYGESFIVVSANRLMDWRLLPGSSDNVLREGDREHVDVVHVVGPPQPGESKFQLPGNGIRGFVDVRVSLSPDFVQVWFVEL